MRATAEYAAVGQLSQEELVVGHAELVKRIAHHLAARLPATVDVEDLIQSGMIALLESAAKYEPSKGASFETYAGIRIRGSMLDEVRRADWTPRSVHRRLRQIAGAVREVEGRTGRDAADTDVATVLGMSLDDYHRALRDSVSSRLFSLEQGRDEFGNDYGAAGDRGQTPLEELEEEGFRDGLIEAIEKLPDREKLVLSLYYDDELNLKEIGAVLGVSESRVCQIHGQAVVRLRARLADWLERH